MPHVVVGGLLLLVIVMAAAPAAAAVITINPSNADASCNEQFENVANSLQPGDELVLHGGTYSQSCRRAITVNGTPAQPITIRAATGEVPILTRPVPPNLDYPQNNIEIVNSSYLVIRGLHFKGGSSGMTVTGHHITLEDNEIYETANNALAINRGNTDSLVIRRNHIHHTGLLDLAAGTTEGEGMYIGCNNNDCTASNHLIEGNYIHHTRGTNDGGNDGIEVKVGSYNNVIRNNVIHDTNLGTRYPCIFVYGDGPGLNTVEGNVMWNCGEAIQVVSDAVIRNNIILTSDVGITAAPHVQVAGVHNVTIVNNTLYGHGECLFIRWSGARNVTLANNAVYCPSATAVDANLGSAVVRSNYVAGSGVSIDNSRFFAGGSATAAFDDPAGRSLWPAQNSVLRNTAAASLAPQLDFNETVRTAPFDVGAYETDGQASNPGWQVVAGFKQIGSSPPPPPPPPTTFLLTVSKVGAGGGTVTSTPAGINCGPDCTEAYTSGTPVALAPVAATGSTFAGWSGNSDCTDGAVTMNAARSCTATFNLTSLAAAADHAAVPSAPGVPRVRVWEVTSR